MKKFLLLFITFLSLNNANAFTKNVHTAARCSTASEFQDSLSILAKRENPYPMLGQSQARIQQGTWKNSQLPITFMVQKSGEVCIDVLFEREMHSLCSAYTSPEHIEGIINLEIFKFIALQVSQGKTITEDNLELRYVDFRDSNLDRRDTFVTCEFVTRFDSQSI